MNHSISEPAIRRILIALDAATQSRSTLESVAKLAAVFQAEVCGIFVEDLDLLRSAELPFVRQVSLPSASDTVFSPPDVERELRNLAAQARRELEKIAERERIKWSFRVVRGHVAKEIISASEEADLVVMESSSRPVTRYVRLRAPARMAYPQTRRSMFFLRAGTWAAKPVLVVFDGSTQAIRALRVASRLAQSSSQKLVIMLSADALGRFSLLQKQADSLLEGLPLVLLWHYLTRAGPSGFCQHARELQTGVVVLAADNPLVQEDDASLLLEKLDCPVLMVR